MNLEFTGTECSFREGVRAFLEANLPESLRRAQRLTTTFFPEFEISSRWHSVLHRQGWVAPAWPLRYGGTGWSAAQRYIWAFECARAGAPRISPIALNLVGPVLMRFGSEAQKDHHLPRILAGLDYWCQGFSEAGAGSDLAALRLDAVREGDDYRLQGSKIWTTHAHHATQMIALVRTSGAGRRQEGITCLLIDMHTSGITVRPIHTIGGDHEVNEVFFDQVRVPATQRVGAEGEGWSVAKYLLDFERGGNVASPQLRTQLAAAARLDQRRHLPSNLEARLAELAVDIDALEMLELRVNLRADAQGKSGAMASMLKLRASQLQQAVSDLALQMLGDDGLRWERRRPFYSIERSSEAAEQALPVVSRYLNNRANTIFGGSSEIQKNIIARALLE